MIIILQYQVFVFLVKLESGGWVWTRILDGISHGNNLKNSSQINGLRYKNGGNV
jgi:hypothetical protein